MDSKNKEITRTVQILLWLWFGLMTSFTAVNVVNIAKLESQIQILENYNQIINSNIHFSQRYFKNK